MRWWLTYLILGALGGAPVGASPQLQLVAGPEPQRVFAGQTQNVSLCWSNSGSSANETEIQLRLMQLTSATAVSIDEMPWKRLQVLPGQTVLETAALEFPAVRAETRFLVQWFDSKSNVLGSTKVVAYQTNLLAELGVLMDHAEGALGVFDPENQLKPLLRNLQVGFVDLDNTVVADYRGKLAIIGPFASKAEGAFPGTGQIKTLSENGVAVVWIQPPAQDSDSRKDDPQPSFYSVPGNRATTMVVQPEMLAQLARNPRSQLNLIYFCKLALHPQPLALPYSKKQP